MLEKRDTDQQMYAADTRPALPSHATRLENSIIDEVVLKGEQLGAVDLAIGSSGLSPPRGMKVAAINALRKNQNHYTDFAGLDRLRAAICQDIIERIGVRKDPENEITVTCGATEGLFCVLSVLTEFGDEIILFEPFYDNFIAAAKLLGLIPRFVNLNWPDWAFEPRALEEASSPRTKLVLLNSPHNPTGKVFTRFELEQILMFCGEKNIWCVCDEIYQDLFFEPFYHTSILHFEKWSYHSIVISGLSKTFQITGWRLGYVVAPADVTAAVRKAHCAITYCAPTPLQFAAVAALEETKEYCIGLRQQLAMRQDVLFNILKCTGFQCKKSQGTVFIMANIEAFDFTNDYDFVNFLMEEIGVTVIPGRCFFSNALYGTHFVRICFSRSLSVLNNAKSRLSKLPCKLPIC